MTVAALKKLAFVSAALVIAGIPFWFAGAGLDAYFTSDDTTNLYGYWTKPWGDLLWANVAWWSPFYRPLGGLFYRVLFAAFGFHPFAFRVACFALLLANLGLLYATARALAGSREVGLLAALLGCYHAGFEDLHYNTGAIFDLLCFSFTVGALLLYVRARQHGGQLRRSRIILLAALYICALNSKEMAAALPVAVLIYECIYHRPKLTKPDLLRWGWDARVLWLLAAMTVPYVFGKLSPASDFSKVSDYHLQVSLGQYLSAYRHYLDRMFYREGGWFTTPRTLLLWVAMLGAAALSRRKTLWFSFLFLLFSVLPVIFVVPRGTIFVLYIPFLGWSLYGASLLVAIRDGLRVKPGLVISATTFAVLALVMVRQPRGHPSPQAAPIRSTTEQIHALLPKLASKTRILFLDDPFDIDDWTPLFLIRLSYADNTIQVDRVKRMPAPPQLSEIKDYDVVLRYKDNMLINVRFGT